jgi:hypothetical protein
MRRIPFFKPYTEIIYKYQNTKYPVIKKIFIQTLKIRPRYIYDTNNKFLCKYILKRSFKSQFFPLDCSALTYEWLKYFGILFNPLTAEYNTALLCDLVSQRQVYLPS